MLRLKASSFMMISVCISVSPAAAGVIASSKPREQAPCR